MNAHAPRNTIAAERKWVVEGGGALECGGKAIIAHLILRKQARSVRQQPLQAVMQLSRCITCIALHDDLSAKPRKWHNPKPDLILDVCCRLRSAAAVLGWQS